MELQEQAKTIRMEPAPSERGFRIELYLEHLEEASFLYEHGLGLRDDPEMAWTDLADFEARFEAHLDALALGGDLALAVCRQQVLEGDFGEVHTAVCVFCRHRRLDLVQEALDGVDPEDEEQARAVRDALSAELPKDWTSEVIRWIEAEGVRGRIAPYVAGYRRLEAGDVLLRVVPACRAEKLRDVAWALGRIRHQPARAALYERCLQHEHPDVRTEAMLALLRMGEQQGIQYCQRVASAQPWALLPLGLGGNGGDARKLRELAAASPLHPDLLHALGLLGDLSAVEVLLPALADDALAEAAATALHLITGAALYEEALIPDEIDEDTLFEEELESLERGEPLTPPGEAPPGKPVVRLSRDSERWRAWWQEHQARFRSGVRYRNGTAFTPGCLLENLMAETSQPQVRRWACEELVIRYGWTEPFEADLPVAQQKRLLEQAAAWMEARQRGLPEGKWYFAGTPALW